MKENDRLTAENLNVVISVYHGDLVKISEVSALLSLIDDINNNAIKNNKTVLFHVDGKDRDMDGHEMIKSFVAYINSKLSGLAGGKK